MKKLHKFLERIETRTREKLSNYPYLYALLGGIGVVLFWRGVWHIADDLSLASEASFIIGTIILLITGIFISEFIGKRLIISGLVGEKKLEEKETEEIETEETQLKNLQHTLSKLEEKLDHMETHLNHDDQKN